MDLKTDGKNKKKNWNIPLFDITLLLLIALAVIGGSYWATNRVETPTAEIVYTVRFAGVDNAYSGTLAEGKTLYSNSGIVMGKIESASVTRALKIRFDGSVTDSEEYRYTETRSNEESDVVITVRVTAEERNGGYFVGGNRVAAGMSVDAMVTGYLGEGLILSVEEAKQQEGETSSEISVP